MRTNINTFKRVRRYVTEISDRMNTGLNSDFRCPGCALGEC